MESQNALTPEDVKTIIGKIIASPKEKVEIPDDFPKSLIKHLSIEDIVLFLTKISEYHLELLHSICHSNFKELGDPYCKLHFLVASEMKRRGLRHYSRTSCDSVVNLIRDWRTYDPKKVPDAVLRDDWRIVNAWYSTLKSGKTFNTPQFKGMSHEEQLNVVKKLLKEIHDEMERRGWNPKELRLDLKKITIGYVKNLDDDDLLDLYRELHDIYGEDVTEEAKDANVILGIELLKRGLYKEHQIDDPLTRATGLEIEEYPSPEQELSDPEKEYIELSDVLNALRNITAIPVQGQPWAGYLSGRIVNESRIDKNSDSDVDIILRQEPDPRAISAIKRALPSWLAEKAHIVFQPDGPIIGYSIPLWNYGYFLVPESEMIKGFGPYREMQNTTTLKPGDKIRPLKQSTGWNKNEFWRFEDLWKNWASKYIDQGIVASKKYDGRAFIIWHLKDGTVKIYTEDRMRDRASALPNVVKELREKFKGHDVCFQAEAVAYDCGSKNIKSADLKESSCEEIPREDTAWLTIGKISPEQERSLVFHVHDFIYFDEDLTKKPYIERIKLASHLKGMQFFNFVKTKIAKSLGSLKKAVSYLRKLKGSEGVFFRAANATYPIKFKGDNRSPLLAKIKNLKSVDVMVWERIPKKGVEGQYVYDTVFRIPCDQKDNFKQTYTWNGKCYAYIGRTFSTAVKCEKGDIIEVLVGRIREYKKGGKRYFTWMFPKFREKRKDKNEPDTLQTIQKIAKVGPEFGVSNLSLELKLKPCPYWDDPDICRFKEIFGKPRDQNLSKIKVEYLKYPVSCPIAWHYKCRYLKPYYYGIAEIEEDGDYENSDFIDELSTDFPEEIVEILQSHYMEYPPGNRVTEGVIQRHCIGDSCHFDFRIKIGDHLVGWTIVGFNRKEDPDLNSLVPERGYRAETKAKQPLVWLFKNKPIGQEWVFKPGTVGAGVEKEGYMVVLDRPKVKVGVLKPYFVEYFLKSDKKFKDWTRVVLTAIKVKKGESDTERMWKFSIPKDQMPYAISNRAMRKGYKPPKNNIPFPENWVKREFPEQYKKWLEYMGEKKELSKIPYAFVVVSWMGPRAKSGRNLPQRRFYLLLGDKEKSARVFLVDGNILSNNKVTAFEIDRVSKSWIDKKGKVGPETQFNPNKKLEADYTPLLKGSVSYSEGVRENGAEEITLKGMNGTWILYQTEKNSDHYILEKKSKAENSGTFILQKHTNKYGSHLSILLSSGYEIKVLSDTLTEEFRTFERKYSNLSKFWFKENKEIELGELKVLVEFLDSGEYSILSEDGSTTTIFFNGEILKGTYLFNKDGTAKIISKYFIEGN